MHGDFRPNFLFQSTCAIVSFQAIILDPAHPASARTFLAFDGTVIKAHYMEGLPALTTPLAHGLEQARDEREKERKEGKEVV